MYIYIYIYIYVIIMTTNGATLVCMKSLATRRYVQQLVQNSNTENVQALHYWSLVSPVDSHHKKPVMRKVFPCHSVIIADYMRDRFGYGLSQWETTLHCNVVSHWLSPFPYYTDLPDQQRWCSLASLHSGTSTHSRDGERRNPTHTWNNIMMTSSKGNIFRVTGLLCGEFTGPRWIPRTKASDAGLWCFLWSAPE